MLQQRLFPVALVASCLLWACSSPERDEPAAPAAEEQAAAAPVATRTLSGRVLAGGSVKPRKPLSVQIDGWVCGEDGATPDPRLRMGAERGVANVVVTVLDAPSAPAYKTERAARVDQKGCVFTPHVQLVAPGQEVLVENNDGVFHNFRTRAGANPAVNKGQPGGVKARVRFAEPEKVHAACDVHHWMSAIVAVAPHAFVALTDENGHFAIEGVPAGARKIELWHELLGTRTVEIPAPAPGAGFEFVWEAE